MSLGGENIYPLEIEERLIAHPSISKASVVGLPDTHYGEIVGAFVKLVEGHKRPQDDELGRWVQSALAKYKTPQHVFWLGDVDVGIDLPHTASGKIQKNKLRLIGERLVKSRGVRGRL
jgi:acyl-CoA synthetase (AMP-forming)/AMP-acid ligase II